MQVIRIMGTPSLVDALRELALRQRHKKTKQMTFQSSALHCFNMSGYQDSNLGPPAPKAGALTGLRYIP